MGQRGRREAEEREKAGDGAPFEVMDVLDEGAL